MDPFGIQPFIESIAYLCALALAVAPIYFGFRWFRRRRSDVEAPRLRAAALLGLIIPISAFPLFHQHFSWRICYETWDWVTDEDFVKLVLEEKSAQDVKNIHWGTAEKFVIIDKKIKSIYAEANGRYVYDPGVYRDSTNYRTAVFYNRESESPELETPEYILNSSQWDDISIYMNPCGEIAVKMRSPEYPDPDRLRFWNPKRR